MSTKRFTVLCLLVLVLSRSDKLPHPPPHTGSTRAGCARRAAPALPALSTPSMTGPLADLPSATFSRGPFGNFRQRFFTGIGIVQNNHVPGDNSDQAALSNGMIFLQKSDGCLSSTRKPARIISPI